jgi:alkaline phosphatase
MLKLNRGARLAAAVIVAASVTTATSAGLAASSAKPAAKPAKIKNVIYLVGDGMGRTHVTAARERFHGADGQLAMEALGTVGQVSTYAVEKGSGQPGDADFVPNYVTDSASSATAWSSGVKTYNAALGVDAKGTVVPTVMELAKQAGFRTGNVSTAEITDATPAVQGSHISLRGCQGPANMAACPLETKAAGGLGSIAEQTVDHKVDVVLGGGRGRFGGPIAGGPDNGKTVEQSAARQGYTEVYTAQDLEAIKQADLPVLGLFATGNMTTEWTGPVAARGDGNPAHTCTTTNRPTNEPSLADMTRKAISLLDSNGRHGNDDGFFLQVEGASIDKQDHAANACAQIGETVAFDNAIGVALEYQRTHPDTLIVVTADHAHTSQIVAEDSNGAGAPTGWSDNLITKDGQTLRLTYGTVGGTTPPASPAALSQQHTGSVVPIWGGGPGAAEILGTTDHTDLFDVLGPDSGHHGW